MPIVTLRKDTSHRQDVDETFKVKAERKKENGCYLFRLDQLELAGVMVPAYIKGWADDNDGGLISVLPHCVVEH